MISNRSFNREVFIASSDKNISEVYHFSKKVLGEGSFGKVWKGTLRSDSRIQRAIKQVRKKDLKEVQSLNNELILMKEIDHPNILKLLEIFEDDTYV